MATELRRLAQPHLLRGRSRRIQGGSAVSELESSWAAPASSNTWAASGWSSASKGRGASPSVVSLSRRASLWHSLEAAALVASAASGVAILVCDIVALAAAPALLPFFALLASRRASFARERAHVLQYQEACARLLELAQQANDDSRLSELAERVAKPQADAAAREVQAALRPVSELSARFRRVESSITQLSQQSDQAAREAGQAAGRVASQSDASRQAAESALQAVQGLSDLPSRLQELEDAVSALEDEQQRMRPGIRETVREEVRSPLAAVPQLVAAMGDTQSIQQQPSVSAGGADRLEAMVYSAASDAVTEALSASAVSELGGLAERVSSLNAKLEEQRTDVETLQQRMTQGVEPALQELARARIVSGDGEAHAGISGGAAITDESEDAFRDRRNGNGSASTSNKSSESAPDDSKSRFEPNESPWDSPANAGTPGHGRQHPQRREDAQMHERSINREQRSDIDYNAVMDESLALLKEGRSLGDGDEAWEMLQQAADGFELLASNEDTRSTAALGNLGNALAALAGVAWLERTDDGASEAEEMLVDAGRCFRAVLRMDASDARAATNWGFALSFRAHIATLYEHRSDAERLYEAALEKFAAAHDAYGEATHATLVAEGDCLSKLAALKSQWQTREDTLVRSKRRYERALRADPESKDAASGLEETMRALSELRGQSRRGGGLAAERPTRQEAARMR